MFLPIPQNVVDEYVALKKIHKMRRITIMDAKEQAIFLSYILESTNVC
jgi:hypothetical protein